MRIQFKFWVLVFNVTLFTWYGTCNAQTHSKTFRAGTAKLKITPAQPSWLLAYDRHQRSKGVEQDLWLRALALEDPLGQRAVIVSADVLGFPPSVSRAILTRARERFRLDAGRILLAASHTHNGPVLPERVSLTIYHNFTPTEAEEVHRYGQLLEDRVVDVIGRAMAELQPARLNYAVGRADFGQNRRLSRNPRGPVDHEVPVLSVRSTTDELMAIVFTYACHATTVMADTFFRYFGDYPGVAAEQLERRHPEALALFVAGCGGDINPAPRGTVTLARRHGRQLAEAVDAVLEAGQLVPLDGRLACRQRTIELPLETLPPRDLLQQMRSHPNKVQQRYAQEMLTHYNRLPTSVPYPILVWDFGGAMTLVALSGEVCVDYALRVKRELVGRRVWVAGYTTEVSCYIPSERVLAEGGYEAGWSNAYGRRAAARSMAIYGWPTPLAEGLEDKILTAVHTLVLPRDREP